MKPYHQGLAAAAAAAVSILAAAPPALAQERGSPEARKARSSVESYLAQKDKEFQGSDRAAQARGMGGRVTSLYNLLRDKGPFRDRRVVGGSAAEQDRVRDALVRTTAYYLASVGMDPDEVNRLQRDGLDPLAAGAAVIGGGATVYDSVVVSQIAVIATVTANSASSGNGVDRQVGFRTDRVLKGSAPAPLTLTVPLPNPPADAAVGEQYLLFLSTDFGSFRRAAWRPGNDGALAQQLSPYKIESGRLTATVPGQDAGGQSVADLDAFLSKHKAAFATAANGGN